MKKAAAMVAESASMAAEGAKKAGEAIGKRDVLGKTVSERVQSVKDELDEAVNVSSRHYQVPSEYVLVSFLIRHNCIL